MIQLENNSKFYICGLGNYGHQYQKQRHNFGSIVINYLQQCLGFDSKADKNFLVYEGSLQDTDLTLLIPKDFMNCVGDILASRVNYFKMDTQNLCVLHDDLETPLGSIKYKFSQGSAGHNGLRSIDGALGKDYHRLRLGIGRPAYRSQVANFVLSDFAPDEVPVVESVSQRVLHMLPSLVRQDISTVKEKCQDVT